MTLVICCCDDYSFKIGVIFSFTLALQNRAGLRQFLDSFGGTEQSTLSITVSSGLSQESSYGTANEKHDSKPRGDVKLSHLASGMDSASSVQTTDTKLADLLDSTLWNRRLAPSSERIVYALVQQIFLGIREYFLASTELKVCKVLMFSFISFLKASTILYLPQTWLMFDKRESRSMLRCIISL